MADKTDSRPTHSYTFLHGLHAMASGQFSSPSRHSFRVHSSSCSLWHQLHRSGLPLSSSLGRPRIFLRPSAVFGPSLCLASGS